MSSSLNVLSIGASKNIGYFAALRLLDAGATVTFLLRKTAVFDADEAVQAHIRAGHAHIVQGDALVEADVARAWTTAASAAPVDVLIFSVGGVPRLTLRGLVIDPPNLVTQALLASLCTAPTPPPRIVVISSMGLTREAHAQLPLALRPLYSLALAAAHRDKAGTERALSHVAGLPWDVAKDGPSDDIMGAGWETRAGLPAAGSAPRVLVVRPALLTDGVCRADEGKKYRVGEVLSGAYTVSRKDVGHFVADAVLNRWSEYEGRRVTVAY